MGDEIECPWEDKFSRRFDQLSVRDDETGECWDSSSLLPSSSSASGASAVPNCNNNVLMPARLRLFSSLTPFKIPKEYSGLGCSSQPSEQKVKCFGYAAMKPEKQPAAAESCTDGEKAAIVATFPAQGKLLGFCRKRRCSGSSNTPPIVPAQASTSGGGGSSGDCCTMPRFLEGREGLLFVGRLFFAFLLLLSPGYMFPLLVIIRTFCHVQRHCHSFDEDETLRLVQPRSPSFGYFGARRFLEMNCRFCRENMKSEKMYRIHVKNGPTLSQRQHLTDRRSQDEGCYHHHHH